MFQCQPTALLRASDSTQVGYMALSVVYFRITHRLGRPHYVWDDYLYSVREKVDCKCNCLCSVIVLCGMMCRLIACSSRKAPRAPPGLTSPSDGQIAINSTIFLFNIYTAEGFGIQSRPVMYNVGIRNCISPPLLEPKFKIFI